MQSLDIFSNNLLSMMRGALMMQFIFMCITLYPRRKENTILNYLFWLLVIMSVFLFFSFGYMIHYLKESVLFVNIKALTDLCLVPLVGSFLLKIMMPKRINASQIILLLAPNIILTVIFTFTQSKLVSSISFTYATLLAITIFIFVVFISVRYDRFLKSRFSNIDNKSVGWVRTVIYFFAVWYLVWSIVIKTNNRWIDFVYYLFIICLWIFIYRNAIKHIISISEQELFETKPKEYSVINDKLSLQLEKYMIEKRPWLNSSLTLADLSVALGTNRSYLSEHINKTLGKTFYDYVNGFRIQYACQLLSNPNLTLIQVSEQVGFNSISTFRRAFSKVTGSSPAAYRMQLFK